MSESIGEKSTGILSNIQEHLDELRRRFKVVLISYIAFTLFFIFFPSNPGNFLNIKLLMSGYPQSIASAVLLLIKSYIDPSGTLLTLQFGAAPEMLILASFVLAAVATSPIFAYEFYRFIDPALYPHERRAVYPFVAAFVSLFVGGAIFGLMVISRFLIYVVNILSPYIGSQPVLSATEFYTMIFLVIVFCGITFTIPAIFVLLVRLGIIKTTVITKHRAWAYIIIYAITAIITPDGGPVADIALFIPVITMMELAVFIAKRYEKPLDSAEGSKVLHICKFCGKEMDGTEVFCPHCKRSRI